MANDDVKSRELRRIYERDGCVQASVVVREATPKKSPLHNEFEWDDKVAGHAYRLSQARRMIRVTAYVDKTGARSRFVHVPVMQVDTPTASVSEREGVYKPIKEVVKDTGDYVRALRELENQRAAMDRTIQQLRRAAKETGKDINLLPQLEDGLRIVKQTLQLMIQNAA